MFSFSNLSVGQCLAWIYLGPGKCCWLAEWADGEMDGGKRNANESLLSDLKSGTVVYVIRLSKFQRQ